MFAEVLNHVVTFGFAMDQKINADFLLEPNDGLDLLRNKLFVLCLSDLAFAQLSTSLSDLLCLL
jgi:hypothetical protein